MLEVIFSLIGDLYINFKDYIFEDILNHTERVSQREDIVIFIMLYLIFFIRIMILWMRISALYIKNNDSGKIRYARNIPSGKFNYTEDDIIVYKRFNLQDKLLIVSKWYKRILIIFYIIYVADIICFLDFLTVKNVISIIFHILFIFFITKPYKKIFEYTFDDLSRYNAHTTDDMRFYDATMSRYKESTKKSKYRF